MFIPEESKGKDSLKLTAALSKCKTPSSSENVVSNVLNIISGWIDKKLVLMVTSWEGKWGIGVRGRRFIFFMSLYSF